MKIHTLKGYIQNIFLIEYEDKLLLLDGCGRADVPLVCRFITHDLSRPLADLTLIVVTHMHPDHAGGAEFLRKKTGALIACHPKAPSWYASFSGRCAHLIDLALMHWVAHRIGKTKKRGWFHPILKPDILLEDGQLLPEFTQWQVLYTPGHTNHDISIFHQQKGVLYVADLIVKVKNQYHPPYPVYYPETYKQSLKRLLGLAQPTLLFAHVKSNVLNDSDIERLLTLSPSQPSSYWLAMKSRIKRALTRVN